MRSIRGVFRFTLPFLLGVCAFAQGPPVILSVENSATGAVRDSTHATAANSFITVYVSGLSAPDSTGNLFPATSYDGIEVEWDDEPMPLYNVLPSKNLINTMLPSNAGNSGAGTLLVKTPAGLSSSYVIELLPADVGIFRLPDPNNPNFMQGAALIAGTNWFAMPASLAPAYNLPTPCTGLAISTPCAQGAAPGEEIVIYFTGASIATAGGVPSAQPLPTGLAAPVNGSVLYETLETPVVTIGGNLANVQWCGIAPGTAAEYQLNVTVPSGVGPGDTIPVQITMSGSTDTVTIAVRSP